MQNELYVLCKNKKTRKPVQLVFRMDPRRDGRFAVRVLVVERTGWERTITTIESIDFSQMRGVPLQDYLVGHAYTVPWDDIAWWLDSAILGL